jgi:hypothetical protein
MLVLMTILKVWAFIQFCDSVIFILIPSISDLNLPAAKFISGHRESLNQQNRSQCKLKNQLYSVDN